eukprot:TRINITY_DN41429_c0_g1_i1.p1 TRINITY_DN41429_c0_g1~~TRINITY_DN41429_c0_g1_i1.p1  ORF type:complete len:643 (-),score=110.83 TRINITY_DN41429_c0_g1_i1:307-2187(-)
MGCRLASRLCDVHTSCKTAFVAPPVSVVGLSSSSSSSSRCRTAWACPPAAADALSSALPAGGIGRLQREPELWSLAACSGALGSAALLRGVRSRKQRSCEALLGVAKRGGKRRLAVTARCSEARGLPNCGSPATGKLKATAAPQAIQEWAATLPAGLLNLMANAEDFGDGSHRVWIVGGAIRDVLTGVRPHEVDLCTTMNPSEVVEALREHGVEPGGAGEIYGTVDIEHDGVSYECTTLRADSASYSDGRRPDSVTFSNCLLQDLARRDFTINAMALDVRRLLLYDPFGGAEDCASGLLRTVGEAHVRLGEDSLRIMRGYRLLDMKIPGRDSQRRTRKADGRLVLALKETVPSLAMISRERVTDELRRILSGPAAPQVVATMAEHGALRITLADGGPAGDGQEDERASFDKEVVALRALWLDFPSLKAHVAGSRWLLALAILLARDEEAERRVAALKLTKREQRTVLRHLECLGHLPSDSSAQSVRLYWTALGEEFGASQLALERAWASAAADAGAISLIDAVRREASALPAGSIAPPALADGRWVMQQTGLKGAGVGVLKDWLYYEQVAADARSLEDVEAMLETLPWRQAFGADSCGTTTAGSGQAGRLPLPNVPKVVWPPLAAR